MRQITTLQPILTQEWSDIPFDIRYYLWNIVARLMNSRDGNIVQLWRSSDNAFKLYRTDSAMRIYATKIVVPMSNYDPQFLMEIMINSENCSYHFEIPRGMKHGYPINMLQDVLVDFDQLSLPAFMYLYRNVLHKRSKNTTTWKSRG